ncbi:MAG: hypothetical protein WAS24_01300 [Thermoplasmata archaeon]
MEQFVESLEFGSSTCVCPMCGKEMKHAARGVPCTEAKCPVCGTRMKGKKCGEGSDA